MLNICYNSFLGVFIDTSVAYFTYKISITMAIPKEEKQNMKLKLSLLLKVHWKIILR